MPLITPLEHRPATVLHIAYLDRHGHPQYGTWRTTESVAPGLDPGQARETVRSAMASQGQELLSLQLELPAGATIELEEAATAPPSHNVVAFKRRA